VEALKGQFAIQQQRGADWQCRGGVAEGAGVLPVNAEINDFMWVQRRVTGLHKQQRKAEEDKQQRAPPAHSVNRSGHRHPMRRQASGRSYRISQLHALRIPRAVRAGHSVSMAITAWMMRNSACLKSASTAQPIWRPNITASCLQVSK
jgi:hypothetical protein